MKAFFFTVIGILFITRAFSQYDNVNLLVQSPDGKTVKLIWFLKSWNKDITGFDIKRKEGLEDWVKLNKKPILPGISGNKDLSIVESDNVEDGRISGRLFKMLQSKKLQQISDTAFLQKLNSDENTIRDISVTLSSDYDLALMYGFAYVDHTIMHKTDYEYGVFITGTDKMLDSVKWNYGQIPDLSAVTEITSKAATTHNGIELIWNADLNKMKTGDIAGFNVYRQGIRLNSMPIPASNNKDLSEFRWYDKTANSSVPTQYSISAESIFGIEGIIRSYTYNPADHPGAYKKAEVTEIASLGYYFKEGIVIKWNFPKEFEKFIKGFYVEKENMPKGYKTVSDLLDPAVREYTDKTESSVTGYIRCNVVAVYNDKTPFPGIEKLYNYFPHREPPSPQNIAAVAIHSDKKNTIKITWDTPIKGDSTTDYYKVFVMDPATNKFNTVTSNLIRVNNYTYSVGPDDALKYKIYVVSIGKSNTESQASDTVSVMAPVSEALQNGK